SDDLTLYFDGVFNSQAAAPNSVPRGAPVPAGAPTVAGSNRLQPVEPRAYFYGVSADAMYRVNDLLTLGLRGEWLRDEEGNLTLRPKFVTVGNNTFFLDRTSNLFAITL